MSTDRRWTIAVAVVALLIGGCAAPATPPDHEAVPPPTAVAPPQVADPRPPVAAAGAVQAGFAELAATIPADIGVAVVPAGGGAVVSFGTWSSGVAWSTIKVPLALAALRAPQSDTAALVAKAITQSDNAAAERLWSQLGAPDHAAQQVRAVLADGGDADTMVEARRLRPGFTAFGQTQWSLARQARFAAHLPCIADAYPVVDLMHNLIESQRWGLAAGGAAAKGGWGPGRAGGYLVRQFGIVATGGGEAGVALAAEPHDGTFDSGVDALNRMAGWLATHAVDLPGGSCTR